jgi:glycosyltransferase involved in cell wall biosynthesis
VNTRLLFMTPFAPRFDAPHGGRVSAQLIYRLAAKFDVAVVCLRDPLERGTDEELRRRCELVVEIPRSSQPERSFLSTRLRRLTALARGVPGLVSRTAEPGYANRLREVVHEWRPHIVQVELHEMGQYLSVVDGCAVRVVLVDHDPGASAAHDLAATGGLLRRVSQDLEARAWRRFMRRTGSRIDAAIVFTERDRRTLGEEWTGMDIVRIAPGLDLPDRALDPVGASPPRLLFFGGYEHPPNADAARRLTEAIYPCVVSHHPEVELDLVGPKPTAEMRRFVRAGVTITDRVPSIDPYLNRAAVVVVPIRLGGGMRVKVLETVAAGKALVASARAVDGLDLPEGRAYLGAETDEEFCAAVVALLADPERRRALAVVARSWAEQNIGWDAVIEQYSGLYERLLESPPKALARA